MSRRIAAAGWAAALACVVAAVVGGLRLDGYSHALHPLSLLGARGVPGAAAFNLIGFVLPGVLAALKDDARPLVVQHLGLLVRYGQEGLVQALRGAAQSGQRPARLLLLPGDSHQPPMLDGVVLPVITPADWTHLPKPWLENRHRAAPAAAVSGNNA